MCVIRLEKKQYTDPDPKQLMKDPRKKLLKNPDPDPDP